MDLLLRNGEIVTKMDMTQCKKGDKLLLRDGEIATLDNIIVKNHALVPKYPYCIVLDGVMRTVTKEGLEFSGTRTPFDVIGFATKENEAIKQELIDKVLETIKSDVINGDMTAIVELLKQVPNEILKSYLPEEGRDQIERQWNTLRQNLTNQIPKMYTCQQYITDCQHFW